MSRSKSVVAAGNTYNPSLIILKEKGYRLWIEETQDRVLWNAAKDGSAFLAYSPPELLGIVTMCETFGDDWNRQSPDIINELFKGDTP